MAAVLSSLTTGYLYQHQHIAADVTPLFVDCRYGPDSFRLTSLPKSQLVKHVLCDLRYDQADRLGALVEEFFTRHGGRNPR